MIKQTGLILFFLGITLVSFAKKPSTSQWITATPASEISTDQAQYYYYRKTFKLRKAVINTTLSVLSENTYNIWINGIPVILDGSNQAENGALIADTVKMKRYLTKGINSISLRTRLVPNETTPPREAINVRLYNPDSLNIVSDNTWMCGIGTALEISKAPHYKINYNASDDVFTNFYNFHYNIKVSGKNQWKKVLLAENSPSISQKQSPGKLVLSQLVHNYMGADFPKYLKDDLLVNWDIQFEDPVYFGFRVESIGQKEITIQLLTKEYGMVDVHYLTKDGDQKFMLDLPLSITSAQINFPEYLKVHNLFFKELGY